MNLEYNPVINGGELILMLDINVPSKHQQSIGTDEGSVLKVDLGRVLDLGKHN